MPPELECGEVVGGRFRVEGLAGRGGMGSVYRAIDLHANIPVALKVIACARPKGSSRFARESHVLSELSHAAIVRYVAHGTKAGDVPFLAMEWLDGEDLSARLSRAPLTVTETLSLIRRATEGLASAHARGVVHRDVKPSNLFLVGRDVASVKVLDFGMARLAEGTPTLTRTGAVLGTIGYMAPEQAVGEKHVGPQADVFSLGCVLFECLTGRLAFAGKNAVAILDKMLRSDPPKVSSVRPELGSGFDALLGRLLAKRPEDRPDDAVTLLHALETLDAPDEPGRPPSAGRSPGARAS